MSDGHEDDPDDYDYLDDQDAFGREDCPEPCGSCEWCGVNVYPDADTGYVDPDGLCEQCAWAAELGQGSEDVGGSGIMPIPGGET